MTAADFKSWLAAHGFKRGQFHAALNAVLAAHGKEPVSYRGVSNWLLRGTPAWLDALLPEVTAQKPIIYQVEVALSPAEDRKLREQCEGMTIEQALQTALRVGLEVEFEIIA